MDIVTAETGILVHDKGAASLMKAIDVLLSDDALRQRMARAARTRVLQNFTLLHQAKAWDGYLADFTPPAHPLR